MDRLRSSWLPEPLNAVYLGSGGSETMDAAIRLARQHAVAKGEPERSNVIELLASVLEASIDSAVRRTLGRNSSRASFVSQFIHSGGDR